MSTTEDYLNQLLNNAINGNSEEGLSIEEAMDMSVDDVLNSLGEESEPKKEPEAKVEVSGSGTGMMSPEEIAAMFAANEEPATEPEAMSETEAEPEPKAEEPAGNGTGMMSPEEIAAMFAATEESATEPEAMSETEAELEPKAEDPAGNGMMSPEEIAAMFAATEEPSPEPEPKAEEPAGNGTGMMSPEEIAAMFAANEEPSTEPEAMSETEAEPEPKAEDPAGNGMMSPEEIAAMFAANEEPSPKEESPSGGTEQDSEMSIDDMLKDIREEEPVSVDDLLGDIVGTPEEIVTEQVNGQGDIMDLLNMMQEDEDLKDIGDLLQQEGSDIELTEEELFGSPGTENQESAIDETKETEKKKGFLSKILEFFTQVPGEEEGAEDADNEQIIKEVEAEIAEEDKKKKKKEKKGKKGKKGKEGAEGTEGAEDEEGEETKDDKKKKKEKKKKEKKEKPPKPVGPKEPALPKKPVVLIMLMGGSIVALVLVSHKFIDYSSSIHKADSAFINRNYQEAYENLLGVNVKEDDKQLADRIKVMMKLEGKYQRYLSHIDKEEYDEALNDLILAVIRYDEYKEEAEALGILDAYNDEYGLIVEQLNQVFGVDEDQARQWYLNLSALDYTETVRNVVKAAGFLVDEVSSDGAEENMEEVSGDLSEFGIEEVEE